MPEDRRALPVLKVLYRNTHRIQEAGGGRAPRTGPADAKARPAKPTPGAARTPTPPANNWFALALAKAKRESGGKP